MKNVDLSGTVEQCLGDKGGNFSLMFGLSAVALLMSAGLAVDFTRALAERSAMTNALDAAVLATARSVAIGEMTQDAAPAYLQSMFLANMNVPIDKHGSYDITEIRFDPATEVLTADAAHVYEAAFPFFGGMNTQTIRTGSSANYRATLAEVAMTFDITGSMAGSKLTALKEAARLGIGDLLKYNRDGNDAVRIAAIPYSDAVNVGALSQYVIADDGEPYAVPMAVGTVDGEKGKGKSNNGRGGHGGRAKKDNCSTERKSTEAGKNSDMQFSNASPADGMINRDGRLQFCPASELIALTTEKTTLQQLVRDFVADGNTAGQIGIQWAWYMLSPGWAAYLPEGSEPLDPAEEDVKKYAIIMTDGLFNTAFAGVGKKQVVRDQPKKSSEYAIELCERMKADNIEIFTIGFELTDKDAKEVMQACATPDRADMRFYYETSSSAELVQAYESIAEQIHMLRLVK